MGMHISGGKFHNSYEKTHTLKLIKTTAWIPTKSIYFNMGNNICDKIFLYENLCIRKTLEAVLFFYSVVIK